MNQNQMLVLPIIRKTSHKKSKERIKIAKTRSKVADLRDS